MPDEEKACHRKMVYATDATADLSNLDRASSGAI